MEILLLWGTSIGFPTKSRTSTPVWGSAAAMTVLSLDLVVYISEEGYK